MPRTPKRADEAAQEQASQPDTAADSPKAAENTQETGPAAGASQPPTASKSLAGLRGAEYVQALAGQPSTTLQVPLLPAERRGDWERAKGQKIPVTARQLQQQNGSGSPRLEGE